MSTPPVEVRRSKRRKRTVSAFRDGDRIIVQIPASLTAAQETEWVQTMVARIERSEAKARLSDEDLATRAAELNTRYLGGMATPSSVQWVSNQKARWGSCTPGNRTVRVSERVRPMPTWVIDYVLVHELAHLLEPGHDAAFWSWVSRYPQAEKAQGYLLGWSAATEMVPPPDREDPDGPGE